VTRQPWLSGWRLTAARLLSLVGVVAISLYIFSIRDQAERLAAYGYPGIFVLSVLANATVILPAPGVAITFAMGAVFHPIGVALAAGSGAALGELTGYLAGFSGEGVIARADFYERVKAWVARNGGPAILILAFIPNPFFDVAGAAAGALRMRVAKFLAWAWVGKVLKMLLFAYAGAASIDWLAELLG
jgi:membrane protein DedA with SNARE-associated domain